MRKPGTTFLYKGVILKIIKTHKCEKCFFSKYNHLNESCFNKDINITGSCCDGNSSIIFKEIKPLTFIELDLE